jgi:hypothetical protein
VPEIDDRDPRSHLSPGPGRAREGARLASDDEAICCDRDVCARSLTEPEGCRMQRQLELDRTQRRIAIHSPHHVIIATAHQEVSADAVATSPSRPLILRSAKLSTLLLLRQSPQTQLRPREPRRLLLSVAVFCGSSARPADPPRMLPPCSDRRSLLGRRPCGAGACWCRRYPATCRHTLASSDKVYDHWQKDVSVRRSTL